jgi:quinol monooxygenase YgiN
VHVVTVQLTLRPDCIDTFLHELGAFRALLEAEPDCLRFDVLQHADHPGSILLIEAWSSRDYFEQVQLKRPYYVPYLERVRPMWAKERRFDHWHCR